jgi:hypothetical protein
MRVQACRFQRKAHGDWEEGLAWVKCYDYYDVEFIVDDSGCKVHEINTYKLNQGFFTYINTDYMESDGKLDIPETIKQRKIKGV